MNKILLTLVSLCLALTVKAEATDISQYDYVLYSDPMTASAGNELTMSVKMKNSEPITGYQFDLVLPEGVSVATDGDGFYLIALSEERTTAKKTNYFDSAEQPDGSIRVMASSTQNYTFSGNDGEVATIKLNVSETMAEGNYPVILKNIVVSEETSQTHKVSQVEMALTIKDDAPTYDEGYLVSIKPFKAAAGTAYTIALNFDGKDENITDIEFDMDMPSILTRTKSGRVTKAFESANDERMYVSGTEGDHQITVDGKHISINAIVSDEYKYIAGTSGPLVNMYYTAAASVAEGVYPVNFTNITLTNGEGNVLKLAPVTSYIKVGNPVSETLTVEGVLTADVNEALANDASVKTLDMSKVTRIEGEMVIIDGRTLVGPKNPVAVEKVSYKRNMTTTWGTVCLPFDVQSNSDAEYYNITGVQNGVLKIQKYETLPAGTPALVKNISGGQLVAEAEDTEIKGAMEDVSGTVLMKGSYTNDTAVTDEDAYYIYNNKFWRCNERFYIDAFRAYFTVSSQVTSSLSIDIEDALTAIDALTGNGDVKVEAVYGADGIQKAEMSSGANILRLSNGKSVTVVVE